ncbi:MAG: sigma-E factor negative regulatory protein [Gammaproteobacteria bacterium]
MTERIREQLSAMVDNHLSEAEQELMTARLKGDRELVGYWYRYHVIGDALRGQLPDHLISMFLDRVRQALRDEPPVGAPSRRKAPAWVKPLAGLAVAASVALVAVLGLRNTQVGSAPEMIVIAEDIQQEVALRPKLVRVRGVKWNVAAPRVVAQLNGYLVNHGEYAVSGGMPGISPHVRIVGYDTGP